MSPMHLSGTPSASANHRSTGGKACGALVHTLRLALLGAMTMLPAHQGPLPKETDEQIVQKLDLERQKMDGLIRQLDGINKDDNQLQKKIDAMPKRPPVAPQPADPIA